jgi:hypothetical protein
MFFIFYSSKGPLSINAFFSKKIAIYRFQNGKWRFNFFEKKLKKKYFFFKKRKIS